MGQVQASWELVGPGTVAFHVFVCSHECVHACVQVRKKSMWRSEVDVGIFLNRSSLYLLLVD